MTALPREVRPSVDEVWSWLGNVTDPEIPVISIVDLGIVRGVEWSTDALVVTITPTYSGCPAMQVIEESIRHELQAHGVPQFRVEQQLAPVWTTEWVSDDGRRKLRDYGIASPSANAVERVVDVSRILKGRPLEDIRCPRCGSNRSQLISQFGSTPCKSLHRCSDCLEPFDYFKPH